MLGQIMSDFPNNLCSCQIVRVSVTQRKNNEYLTLRASLCVCVLDPLDIRVSLDFYSF